MHVYWTRWPATDILVVHKIPCTTTYKIICYICIISKWIWGNNVSEQDNHSRAQRGMQVLDFVLKVKPALRIWAHSKTWFKQRSWFKTIKFLQKGYFTCVREALWIQLLNPNVTLLKTFSADQTGSYMITEVLKCFLDGQHHITCKVYNRQTHCKIGLWTLLAWIKVCFGNYQKPMPSWRIFRRYVKSWNFLPHTVSFWNGQYGDKKKSKLSDMSILISKLAQPWMISACNRIRFIVLMLVNNANNAKKINCCHQSFLNTLVPQVNKKNTADHCFSNIVFSNVYKMNLIQIELYCDTVWNHVDT